MTDQQLIHPDRLTAKGTVFEGALRARGPREPRRGAGLAGRRASLPGHGAPGQCASARRVVYNRRFRFSHVPDALSKSFRHEVAIDDRLVLVGVGGRAPCRSRKRATARISSSRPRRSTCGTWSRRRSSSPADGAAQARLGAGAGGDRERPGKPSPFAALAGLKTTRNEIADPDSKENTMAVQQNKKSPSKRGMHRAHDFLVKPPDRGRAHHGRDAPAPPHLAVGRTTAARRSSRPRTERPADGRRPALQARCDEDRHRRRRHGRGPRSRRSPSPPASTSSPRMARRAAAGGARRAPRGRARARSAPRATPAHRGRPRHRGGRHGRGHPHRHPHQAPFLDARGHRPGEGGPRAGLRERGQHRRPHGHRQVRPEDAARHRPARHLRRAAHAQGRGLRARPRRQRRLHARPPAAVRRHGRHAGARPWRSARAPRSGCSTSAPRRSRATRSSRRPASCSRRARSTSTATSRATTSTRAPPTSWSATASSATSRSRPPRGSRR